MKNLCHFEMGGVWQMLTSSGGGRSMLTVADRGEGGGIKFAKILLTSYVNAPLVKMARALQTILYVANLSNLYQIRILAAISSLYFYILNITTNAMILKHKSLELYYKIYTIRGTNLIQIIIGQFQYQ